METLEKIQQSVPRWRGAPLDSNYPLLIWANDGLGDTIQFSRYIPWVSKLVEKIYFLVPGNVFETWTNPTDPVPSLKPLFKDYERYVEAILIKGWDELPECSYQIDVMQLVTIFHHIPEAPLFHIPPDSQINKLFSKDQTNVALATRGSLAFPDDENRSIPDEDIAGEIDHLLSLPINLWDIHLEPRPWSVNCKRVTVEENNILTLANIIRNCNLVISVDTMIAHLAGSLGIPIWMLHPRSPRTRWAFQTTTPWYPSMRIFDYEGSWKKTLQTITETLKYGGMV